MVWGSAFCGELPGDYLGEGIGCGILIGGDLYSGSALLSGEFGHVTVDPSGPTCYSGERGCLETDVSIQRIVAACGGTFAGLCKRARQGDAAALWGDSAAFHSGTGDWIAHGCEQSGSGRRLPRRRGVSLAAAY